MAATACELGWGLVRFHAEQAFVQSKFDEVVGIIHVREGCKAGTEVFPAGAQAIRTWTSA